MGYLPQYATSYLVPIRIEKLSSRSTMAYRLAGLRIVSDFPLSGLPICHDAVAARNEIAIRRARVPESLSSATVVFRDGQCSENELLLNIPGVARYLLRGGKEILVDQALASNHSDLCAYLLGTVFGVLCHQRGILPLHASAIDVADGCVALVGESGAGKSTLVAALAARGHQVISDDVCFLQRGSNGYVGAWPGLNRIRLWEDAMEALGCDGPGVERELRGYNKFLIPIQSPPNPERPRRLQRIYQLCAAPEGDPTNVNRLQGAAAVEALMQNVYRLGLAEYMGYKPAAFVVCAAAARDVPVFRFSRPLGFDTLHEGVEFLEDHMRD
jgi:hypothetical protein